MPYYVHLPDGRKLEFDDNVPLQQAQYQGFLAMQKPVAQPEKPATGGLSEYLPIGYGLDVAQQGLYSALEGAARSAGLEGIADWAKRGVERNVQEAEASLPEAQRIDWDKVQDIPSFLKFAGQSIATTIPQTAATLGAAGIGGIFGNVPGAIAAGTAAALPFTYGQHRERQIGEQAKQGIPREQAKMDELAAFGYAVPSAALDTFSDRLTFGLGRLWGVPAKKISEEVGRSLAPRIARGIGVGTASEVPTEVAQQVLERAQAGLDLLSDDAMKEYKEAAIGAAVVGGTFGGAAEGVLGRRPQAPKPQEELPGIRQALDESRSIANITTPIGELPWNNAFDFYNKRYENIGKFAKNEDETVELGNILLARETKTISDKIEQLRANLETASNDAEENKINGQIRNLENQLPSVDKPRRGYKKPFTADQINDALSEVRGFKQVYTEPAGPPEMLRLPAPEAPSTPQIAQSNLPENSSMIWKYEGVQEPIIPTGSKATDANGNDLWGARVLSSGQFRWIPDNQITIQLPDQSLTYWRDAFPATATVSAETVPSEAAREGVGTYRETEQDRATLLQRAREAGVIVPETQAETIVEQPSEQLTQPTEQAEAARPEINAADLEMMARGILPREYSAREGTEAPAAPQNPTGPIILGANKVIDDYLSGIEGRGEQGKKTADGLRAALNNRLLSNNQVYAAFLAADKINGLLPQTANHKIEFVHELYGDDPVALAKSGASNVKRKAVQGERIAPTQLSSGTIEEGIIRISLADNMLSTIRETAAHEAYHVLQDYYAKYNPDFRKQIDEGFQPTTEVRGVDGNAILDADGKPVKGLLMSEIDESIRKKLSSFKSDNGKTYFENLIQDIPGVVSVKEAQAYAFAALYDANKRGIPITNMKPAYVRFLDFLKKFFGGMKSSLNKGKIREFNDVFSALNVEQFEGKPTVAGGENLYGTSAPEYSARDVSQYALRAPAPQTASTLERVTGEHYNRPNVLSRALRSIVGAKEGERWQDALVRTTVNRTHPIYVLEELMRSKGLWTGRSAARAMEMALNNTGRIQVLADHGMLQYNKSTGEVEFMNGSKSLLDIFGGKVPDSLKKEFQLYAVALRERDLRKNGKQGFFNISDAEVNDVIQKYEKSHPEWKTVASDLQKFNEGLIKFALDTGTIDQKTANKLNSMFYTPYYRQMQSDVDGSPEQVLGPSLTRSLNNPRAFPHPLRGGSEAIGDLYENIIRNADSIIRAGMKNVAMRDASKLLEIANLAKSTTHAGTRDEKVISFRDNGKPVYYQINDPVLWSAIGGLPAQSRTGIFKAMDSVARFFRDMVTLAPNFMLANLWRGKIVAYVQEGQPFFNGTMNGFKDALRYGDASRNISAITGFGGYSYGMGERNVANNFARKIRIAGGEASMFDRIRQGIDALHHVSEATEMAERVSIYNRLVKEGYSEGDAAWRAYQFAPFSRSGSGEAGIGSILQSLMPMIPFLNAKVQGLARVIEGVPGDKKVLGLSKQLMMRGMLITAFSLATAAFARSTDPERWDSESMDNIMNYDILGYIDGNPIQLPRAFEIGTFFGALPVFIVRQFTQERGENLGKVLSVAMMNTFGFSPIPPAVKPLIEVAANKDFFRDRPLEGLAEQRFPAAQRISPTTSGIAKGIGALAGATGVPLSPIQAQHLIEGYLGTLGTTFVALADNIAGAAGIAPNKPTGAFGDPYSAGSIAAQIAGLDRFYRAGWTRPDRFVNDFYNLKRDVDQVYNFVRDAQRTGDLEAVRGMIEEKKLPLQMRESLNNAANQMAAIKKRMDFVRKDAAMSTDDKTKEMNQLREMQGRIAKQIVIQADRIGAI